VVTPQASITSDDRYWGSVKGAKEANELKTYLNKFPGGMYVESVGIRLRSLEQAASERSGLRCSGTSTMSSRPTRSAGACSAAHSHSITGTAGRWWGCKMGGLNDYNMMATENCKNLEFQQVINR